MTITLTPDVAAALAEKAKQQGTTPEALANEYLRKGVLPTVPTEKRGLSGEPLYDRLKDFIGCCDSSKVATPPKVNADPYSLAFAEILEEKRKQGRL